MVKMMMMMTTMMMTTMMVVIMISLVLLVSLDWQVLSFPILLCLSPLLSQQPRPLLHHRQLLQHRLRSESSFMQLETGDVITMCFRVLLHLLWIMLHERCWVSQLQFWDWETVSNLQEESTVLLTKNSTSRSSSHTSMIRFKCLGLMPLEIWITRTLLGVAVLLTLSRFNACLTEDRSRALQSIKWTQG